MPVDYHAWTHRPKAQGGTDPIEVNGIDRAYMSAVDFQTIVSDTTTPLTNYDPDLSVDGTYITTDETPGDFLIQTTGIYFVQLSVIYDSAFAGAKMARIALNAVEALQGTQYWTNWVTEDDPGLNVDQVVVHALFFSTAWSIPGQVRGSTRQESGSPQDVLEVDFSIVRLGEY